MVRSICLCARQVNVLATPQNCKNFTIFQFLVNSEQSFLHVLSEKIDICIHINETNKPFHCYPNMLTGSNTPKHTRRLLMLYSNTLVHYGLLSNNKLLPSNNITSQQLGCVQESRGSKTKCVCSCT